MNMRIDKPRAPLLAALLAALTGGFYAQAESPPDFNDLVGTRAKQPKPAPASTFQRAAEQGFAVPQQGIPLEQVAPQQESHRSMPPALNPNAMKATITEEQARDFVRDYLYAAEQDNPRSEIGFYADKVDYFNRGRVGKRAVAQDQHRYYQRWPYRDFALIGEPRVISLKEDEAVVRFRMRYRVGRGQRVYGGETENTMTIRQTEEGRKIVAIRETRR